MEKANKPDEVDLFELFLRGVNTLRANFWLILLFFCVGTAIGLVYYYSSKKIYESRIVVSSTILTRSFSEALIDNLNRHRRESNIETVRSLLNVSQEIATNIVHLEVENLSRVDDLKEPDKFVITAQVYTPEILQGLEQGIIYYLENNDYVKIRVAENKSSLEQTLAQLNREIKDIEALKEKIIDGNFFERANGNIMFDPTTVNTKILELTKEKLLVQTNLKLINSVQVIEGFPKFDRPSTPRLYVSLISGSFVGLVLVSILIAFKTVRKLLNMAHEVKPKQ
ncbi:Wzz/FepE/Etk N-terminal domain-containing protein [Chryseolinea sp. H1M3-3]|uniref:Wzz/FepE/Etk N-terminal domain-containing protein n=1 Tax=Chryseolinea sp. H1M3-3 TaxID=3034144 RepID=UPI0023EAAF2B|nr:Wzz/FepE/Etk N-terminal domain-containing protein [Chryseolinea sp. H1M3-3]